MRPPVTDCHFKIPSDDNAYMLLLLHPKYTVPSEPIEADEYILLPTLVRYFHFKLPDDVRAYM